MAKAKGKSEVALVGKNNLPAPVATMREESRQGLENIGQEDMAIPFLKILEKLSPEVDKQKPDRFIDGAEAGDIWDSVNEILYKQEDGLYVIPLTYKKEDIEWRLRSAGGGLVRIYPTSENILAKTKKSADGKRDMLMDDTEILRTHQHLVIVVTKDGGQYPAIIAMTKSRMKDSKAWNSKLAGLKFEDKDGSYTPPSFGTIWHITTKGKSNDQGSWSVWDIKFHGPVDDGEIYQTAKLTRDAGLSGAIEVKYEDLQDTSPKGVNENQKPNSDDSPQGEPPF